MSLVRVKDDPKLLRDKTSGAVLNSDKHTYNQILKAREKQKEKESSMESELESLRNEVQTMKEMIELLINNSNRNNLEK